MDIPVDVAGSLDVDQDGARPVRVSVNLLDTGAERTKITDEMKGRQIKDHIPGK